MSIVSSSSSGGTSLPATATASTAADDDDDDDTAADDDPPSPSTPVWNCLMCNKYFCDKYFLEKHNRKCIEKIGNSLEGANVESISDISRPNIMSLHSSNEDNANMSTSMVTNVQRVRRHSCPMCAKSFAQKQGLLYHAKTSHASLDVATVCPTRFKTVLKCPGCPVKNKSSIALYDHIRDNHAEDEIPGVLFFDTVADFQTWKLDEEARTVSMFIKKHGSRNKNIEHYYCRRSGTYSSLGTQKRHIKVQGSCKAGSKCPASMSATCTPRGVMVMYSSNHSGHDMALKHVALRHSERQRIAEMISSGIPFDEILDSVRDDLSPTEITRLQLLERRDLSNIVKEFNLGKVKHMNDADNVHIWVEMCRQEKSDIVRFVKFPGEEGPNDSHHDGRIGLNDFMMVLMNDVQLYMLQRYGNHRVNCMDSSHDGTNTFKFKLTTLMVIDNDGEGFPVAFCISSKVDALAMEVFLEHVRTALGDSVVGAVLMTDGAPACVDAWSVVMGPPVHHILCAWDIERNWWKNLEKKIKGTNEFKAEVYNTLHVLRDADNREKFNDLLKSALDNMDADEVMTEFSAYFRREFVSRPEVWAYSYRLGLPCHHNNVRLESFHQALKQALIQGRKVRRLDMSLNGLLRLLRHKTFDRILRQEGCNLKEHISDIHKRHVLSGSTKVEQIEVDGKHEVWIVHEKRGDYTVSRASPEDLQRLHTSDDHLCPLVCDTCIVCVHTMTCTCLDYELRNTVCRHIHAVVQLCGMETAASDPDTRIEEHDMNFTIEENVDDLYEEMVLVPLANSSHIAVEVRMELDAGFASNEGN